MFSTEKAPGQAELLRPHKCGVATYVMELLPLPYFCFILFSSLNASAVSPLMDVIGWAGRTRW